MAVYDKTTSEYNQKRSALQREADCMRKKQANAQVTSVGLDYLMGWTRLGHWVTFGQVWPVLKNDQIWPELDHMRSLTIRKCFDVSCRLFCEPHPLIRTITYYCL